MFRMLPILLSRNRVLASKTAREFAIAVVVTLPVTIIRLVRTVIVIAGCPAVVRTRALPTRSLFVIIDCSHLDARLSFDPADHRFLVRASSLGATNDVPLVGELYE